MGLWDKIKGEFIDIVEWTDPTEDTIVHRFERYGNEIKNGAKLTVRESQVALFINEGKLADVFKPGMYDLTTQNLPILSTLQGWKHGFESPFKAEVYFVNIKKFIDYKWGTPTPVTIEDPRFGMFEVTAFGNYDFQVDDPGKFVIEFVGTDGDYTTDQIEGKLRSMVVQEVVDALGEGSDMELKKLAGQVNELAEFLHGQIKDDFTKYGINLFNLQITGLNIPEEIKKEIYELSRLGKIDMQAYTQYKTAKSIEKAAENDGMAGGGMGMGMGFAMANQMSQSMSQQQQQSNQGQGTPPPPPPTLQYHVVVNGQQAGPFDLNTLKGMVQKGEISKESLVWKQGMSDWAKAESQDALKDIFGSVPPPIPPSN